MIGAAIKTDEINAAARNFNRVITALLKTVIIERFVEEPVPDPEGKAIIIIALAISISSTPAFRDIPSP
jgi:hypothetical protein